MKRLLLSLFIVISGFVASAAIAAPDTSTPAVCPYGTQGGRTYVQSTYPCNGGGAVVNGVYDATADPAGCPKSPFPGGPTADNVACPTSGGAIVSGTYQSGGTCTQLSSPLNSGATQVCSNGKDGGVIFSYLRMAIQFLSSAVGIVIVLMIVIGGIQYITSAGDPSAVKNAKTRIINAITGLILFLLMFAILNFIIPGGILG
jgi:hypothetical protein